ncbi:MAG: DUF3293 domain-containing protein [Planctomycetota bacterium]|nr:DUF3293 domain-containing protein [Planctomycetota bacterium]
MKPNPELLKAYQATTYYADLPSGRVALRIGERSPELDNILVQHEVGSWIFITACNPQSKQLPLKENRKRLESLDKALTDREIIHFPGEGLGDSGAWPCESSFLAIGMNLEEAIALGREHGQHAVVFGRFNKPAQLVWCNE